MQSSLAAIILLASPAAASGPDIRVTDVYEAVRWGTSNGITAYSLGTIACNIGDAPAAWYRDTDQHPVIATNLYRLKDGRFEQIGLSWVKHTFAADVAPICGTCHFPPDFGRQLGVGCGDAYSAYINGSVSYLGPRSQVNAFTGAFTFPVDTSALPAAAPTIGRRLQVATSAVQPSLNTGARYFAEAQYVSPDEALLGNGENSATTREAFVAENLNISMGPLVAVERAAAEMWANVDPGVFLRRSRVADEGTYIVASRATSLGGGKWRYNYTIENINSDRGAGSLALPVDSCAQIASYWGSVPVYHSGEPYEQAQWTYSRTGGRLAWSCTAYGINPNANALRWGTASAFEIVCNRPPRPGTAVLGLFKPGSSSSPSALWVEVVLPGGNPDFNLDGFLDGFDYDDFVQAFEEGVPESDFNGDGFTDGFDYDDFVTAFETEC